MSSAVTVGLVGGGPVAEAAESALADVAVEVRAMGAGELGDAALAVVAGPAGGAVFDEANRAATGPWIGVELGGIGGVAHPDVEASVAGFGPEAGCFDCLRSRVASNLESSPTADPSTTRSDARLAGAIAGREAVAFLAGDGDVPGRVTELPFRRRRLLPVPGCRCGSARDRSPRREAGSLTVDEAVSRAERAVDDRIGIVRAIGEAESFPAPYYLATICDTTGFSDAAAADQTAGVAADWNPAFMKAMGEAFERYCAGVYRTEEFLEAPGSALDDAVVPAAFVRPEEGYWTPGPDDEIAWVPGEDLATGGRVHLPAGLVHFPPPEEGLAPSITTGLGLGSSGVDALIAGLTEVIERDATMLAWYSTFEPLVLDVDDAVVETLKRRAGGEGLSVTTLLVTQDVDVPVVAAAVHREGDWPRFAAGSGADLDPALAARSAVAEAIQNWMELRGMGPEGAAEQPEAIARYADFPPAARAFLDVDRQVRAAEIAPDEPPTGSDALAALLDRLAEIGLDAYATRLTTRDVERLGFEAVRVLVPAAQPLFLEERFFGERARTVPRALGFRPRLDREPHPYP